jgi:hypothetical protein
VKTCKVCGEEKPIDGFYRAGGMADGQRTYGITIADYDRILSRQHGLCAICGEQRPEERTLHVDHDHATGTVRGLLCFRCNNALGDLRDDHELFRRAADYLDRDEELAGLVRARAGALSG